ncbi:MAG: hypothetical protein ABI548_12785 [Polyangiaceae bacterium]
MEFERSFAWLALAGVLGGSACSSVTGIGLPTVNDRPSSQNVQNQGAVSITVGKPAQPVNDMACPVEGELSAIGAPKVPTELNPGTSVVNGEQGYSVSCSVTGRGPFVFSGSIHGVSADGQLITVSFRNGMLGADFKGSADVSVLTPQLGETLSSSAPCTVMALQNQAKPGSLWATFSCPQTALPPSTTCSASGVIVFENCAGS